MDLEGRNGLLKEIEEIEKEIEEIKKRIPPHSVRYEIIQLLETKEQELDKRKAALNQGENGGSDSVRNHKRKMDHPRDRS